jgi:hypothetical protein
MSGEIEENADCGVMEGFVTVVSNNAGSDLILI